MPIGYELMTTTEFRPGQKPLVQHYFVKYDWVMDGKGVRDAFPVRDQFGQRQISLSFNPEGAARFAQVTTENVGRQLAIVLDGKLYCAPNIKEPITGGNASISGSFSEEECKNISDALVSGSFPFQIKVDAVFDTDPKLGADNVSNGVWVALWSMAGVVVFMMAYYLIGGVISVIALIINLLLLLGAMAAFDATLTLPGIAGIVLTIGMAVDANVLIFERIREELKNGKSLIPAVDAGYSNALSAVIDSNLTTLITSIILMSVGTGAIKGFAVALSIGILGLKSTGWVTVEVQSFEELQTLGVVQSEHALDVLWFSYVMVPAIGCLLAYICWMFYKLNDKDVQIMADCNAGKITREEAEKMPLRKRIDERKRKRYNYRVEIRIL